MTRTLAAPRGQRWLMGGAALATALLFDGLLLGVALFEDARAALGGALLLLPLHLLWLHVLERLHRVVELGPAGLRLRAWWGGFAVPAAELLGWEDDPALILHTPGGPRRLRLGSRDREAAVAAALGEAFPERPGRAARWIAAGLPLRLGRRPGVLWGTAGAAAGGLGVGALGLSGLGLGLSRLLTGAGEAGAGLVGGVLMLLGAALMLWIALGHTVLAWEFGPGAVRERTALGARRWPAAALRAVELRSERRVHKGVARTAWLLELRFEGTEGPLQVEPGENGLHLSGHSPLADKALLEDLGAALRRLYRLDGG